MEIQEALSRMAMHSSWYVIVGFSVSALAAQAQRLQCSLCVLRLTLRRTWTWLADQVSLAFRALMPLVVHL